MGNKQRRHGKETRPATESVCTRTKKFWAKRLKKYWPEMIFVVVFFLATGAVHFFWFPYDEFFVERDPTLSYPYIEDSQCLLPIPLIIFLAICLPIILTLILQIIIRFWKRPDNIHPKAIDPFFGLLVIGEALAINGLFSEFLKSYVGKKRPNFFAMCNYHGYREAIATNDFRYYNAHTEPNRIGSVANCWDKTTFISSQVRSSYPSGHASYSFCGYTIFALLLIYVWHCHTRGYKIFKVLLFLLFMFVALVLSWSRTIDYWHTHDDIFAGAVLGAIAGTIIFMLNYSFSTVDKLKKKLERDIQTKTGEDEEAGIVGQRKNKEDKKEDKKEEKAPTSVVHHPKQKEVDSGDQYHQFDQV